MNLHVQDYIQKHNHDAVHIFIFFPPAPFPLTLKFVIAVLDPDPVLFVRILIWADPVGVMNRCFAVLLIALTSVSEKNTQYR